MSGQNLKPRKSTSRKRAQNPPNLNGFHSVATEEDFLKEVIFPMFYNSAGMENPDFYIYNFSCIMGTKHCSPIYSIDNRYMKIVFLTSCEHFGTPVWEVSVHIKNHSYCDRRLKKFRRWFFKYYHEISDVEDYPVYDDMPLKFQYPGLKRNSEEVNDFTMYLCGTRGQYIFFELMNSLRLF